MISTRLGSAATELGRPATVLGLAASLITGLAGTASGSYVGLDTTVSQVSQNGWVSSDNRELMAVRVYAVFSRDADHVNGIAGTPDNLLTISTTDDDGFYQCAAGGNDTEGINSALYSGFPSLKSDSWVTVGLEDSTGNNLLSTGIDFTDFNNGGGIVIDNGMWLVSPEDVQGDGSASPDDRVLVGQFTVGLGETVSGTINVQWRDTTGATVFATAQTFRQLAISPLARGADFNGDGKDDSLFHEYLTGKDFAQIRNGTVVDSSGYVSSGIPGWTLHSVGDFNGDNKTDMLFWASGAKKYWVALKNGLVNHTLGGGFISSNISGWELHQTGDFNGDGKTDMLWFNTNNDRWWVALRNGFGVLDGFYIDAGVGDTSAMPWGIADFNADGIDDIVWYTASDNRHWIDMMDGTGHIDLGGYISSGLSGWNLEFVADFNGDGNSDLLYHDTGSGKHWMALKNGLNSAGGAYVSSGLEGWNIVACDDFNADGKADLLYCNTQTGNHWLALRNGLVNHPDGGGWIGGSYPYALGRIGDYNGDGCADVAWFKSDIDRYFLAIRCAFSSLASDWMKAANADDVLVH
ncbi:MAG: VCBS repeat-containing protein [Planctomycetes bacterium]|nr:VCBS repeat-containing protein [Planctomycetota bacterium]